MRIYFKLIFFCGLINHFWLWTYAANANASTLYSCVLRPLCVSVCVCGRVFACVLDCMCMNERAWNFQIFELVAIALKDSQHIWVKWAVRPTIEIGYNWLALQTEWLEEITYSYHSLSSCGCRFKRVTCKWNNHLRLVLTWSSYWKVTKMDA